MSDKPTPFNLFDDLSRALDTSATDAPLPPKSSDDIARDILTLIELTRAMFKDKSEEECEAWINASNPILFNYSPLDIVNNDDPSHLFKWMIEHTK